MAAGRSTKGGPWRSTPMITIDPSTGIPVYEEIRDPAEGAAAQRFYDNCMETKGYRYSDENHWTRRNGR
jgi:hypothetical protein